MVPHFQAPMILRQIAVEAVFGNLFVNQVRFLILFNLMVPHFPAPMILRQITVDAVFGNPFVIGTLAMIQIAVITDCWEKILVLRGQKVVLVNGDVCDF
jgi:hypothetical protein